MASYRIYDYALSDEEVLQNYEATKDFLGEPPQTRLCIDGSYKTASLSEVGPTDGLIGWWPLKHDSKDIAGPNDGTVHGGEFVYSDGFHCAEFDGSGYVNLGNSLYLSDNHPLTATGWIYLNSVSSRDMLLSRNNSLKSGSPYTWLLGIRDNGTLMGAYDGDTWRDISYPFQTGRWYHLAFSYNGSVMRYYVDGAEIGTYSGWSFSDSATGRNTQIGGYSGTTGDIDGRYSDVRFYDRGLSKEEIVTLYEMGKSTFLTKAGRSGQQYILKQYNEVD